MENERREGLQQDQEGFWTGALECVVEAGRQWGLPEVHLMEHWPRLLLPRLRWQHRQGRRESAGAMGVDEVGLHCGLCAQDGRSLVQPGDRWLVVPQLVQGGSL